MVHVRMVCLGAPRHKEATTEIKEGILTHKKSLLVGFEGNWSSLPRICSKDIIRNRVLAGRIEALLYICNNQRVLKR